MSEILSAAPQSGRANPQDGAGDRRVLSSENILVRTAAHAPANDGLLHGRVRLCRVCRTETTNDRYCDACVESGVHLQTCIRCGQGFDAFGPRKAASDDLCLQCLDDDARREERAAAQSEQCRIHQVRYVEDLPVHVLEEMQRGRC